MSPQDNAHAYLLGAAVEAEKHEDTAYELSAGQVAEMRTWLAGWTVCPWCEADIAGSAVNPERHPPEPHRPDCLLADIVTEESS